MSRDDKIKMIETIIGIFLFMDGWYFKSNTTLTIGITLVIVGIGIDWIIILGSFIKALIIDVIN